MEDSRGGGNGEGKQRLEGEMEWGSTTRCGKWRGEAPTGGEMERGMRLAEQGGGSIIEFEAVLTLL
jgi:hypothetical protein